LKNKLILLLSALSATGCYQKDNENNNKIEKVLDNTFSRINKITHLDSYESKMLSSTWIIKTSETPGINAIFKKEENGLKITSKFKEYGYIYLRQIIKNIYQFESKKIKIKIIYDNIMENDLRYDIYIQSRFISDNTTRILVTDTLAEQFKVGRNLVIEKSFEVPNFEDNYDLRIDKTEGLSVAFRLINDKEEQTNILIKKISIEILEED